MEQTRRRINLVISLAVILGGVAVMVLLIVTKPLPEMRSTPHPLPAVEVVEVSPVAYRAPVVGYGTVRPKRQVKIIPEVDGRIIEAHPDLAVGNIIAKGELLFAVDRQAYETKVAQGKAECERLETALKRHEQDRISLTKRLALAKEHAEVAKESLEREEGLVANDAVPPAELDVYRERLLQRRDAVLAYESQLALIPLQIKETTALLTTRRAQLEEAKLNLDHARVYCPFDARVDQVAVTESQVVVAGIQVAALTDMEALELPVVIDPGDLQWIHEDAFNGFDAQDRPELQVRVSWTAGSSELSWTGRVVRLEKLDESTRSAHVVVEIRDIETCNDCLDGKTTTPLSVGMFCRAELPTRILPGAMVIPRRAIRDDQFVYVFKPNPNDPDTRGHLVTRQVKILRRSGDEVLVGYETDETGASSAARAESSKGLELRPGDLVIVSALPKAVNGMALALRHSAGGADAVAANSAEEHTQQQEAAAPVSSSTDGVR